MLILRIGREGDFPTLSQALEQTPPDRPLTLLLGEGVFREKIFCHRRVLRMVGAGAEQTTILWQDGAWDTHPDGGKTGTFRSYTAFFDGDELLVEDLTIENAAGDGRLRGQAIAAAVHTRHVWFHNVRLKGFQDTLFLGPLPERERLPEGFLGPRQHTPRIATRQLYTDCQITGDVDFIFGGGDALFRQCRLHAVGDRGGYLAAPATGPQGMGFVFQECRVTAEQPQSLYLARPWRPGARAVFLHCSLDNGIAFPGFDPWDCQPEEFEFLEFPPPVESRQYSRVLDARQAEHWTNVAQEWEASLRIRFSGIFPQLPI